MKVIKGGKDPTKKKDDYQTKLKKRKQLAKTLSKEERESFRKNELMAEFLHNINDEMLDPKKYRFQMTKETAPDGSIVVRLEFKPKGGRK